MNFKRLLTRFVVPVGLLLFSIVLISGDKLRTARTSAGRVVISEDSPCRLVEDAAVGIAQWDEAFKLGQNQQVGNLSDASKSRRSTIKALISRTDAGCSVDMTDYLPQTIRDRAGKKAVKDGPNCWNTSLLVAGLLPYSSYTTPEEMNFWLSSPNCRALKVGETPIPGDVLAIREDNGGETHGFTYLNNDVVFTKNGYSRNSQFEFSTKADVLGVYGVDPANANVRMTDTNTLSPKPTGSYCQTFRCRHPNYNLTSGQQTASDSLRTIGECVDREALGSAPRKGSPVLNIETLKITVMALKTEAESEISALMSDEAAGQCPALDSGQMVDLDFWRSVKFRADSLLEQIDML